MTIFYLFWATVMRVDLKDIKKLSLLLLLIYGLTTRPHAQPEVDLQQCIQKALSAKNQQPDSALIYAREGIVVARKNADWKSESMLYEIVGDVLYSQFNYGMASEYYLKALSIYESKRDDKGQSRMLNSLGRANAQGGFPSKAMAYMQRAIELDSSRNDKQQLATTLYNYAFAFERARNPERAFEYLEACQKLDPGDRLSVKITESYASLYEDLHQFDTAREKYLSLQNRIDEMSPEGADLINNLGDTYRKTGQYWKAIPYYQKGLKITYNINYIWGKHQNHRDIAECYANLEMYKLAYEHQTKEIEIYSEAVNTQSSRQQYYLNLMYDLDSKNNLLALQEEKTINRTRERNFLILIIVIISIAIVYLSYLFVRLRKSQRNVLAQNKLLQDRKREIETTQALLIQSEKMASIGTFTAGIAHELNNPLNLIANGINYLNSVISETEKPAKLTNTEIKSARKIIDEGLRKTQHIIKTLLTFSYPTHSGKSKKKVLLINEIIQNTVMLIKGSIPENIAIDLDLKSTSAVDVYPEKIHQVLINLINNAVDELRDTRGMNTISLHTHDTVNEVVLTVANSGSKIPENIIDTIFEPFFTTKERGRGSGLGLWITSSLVRDHGGDISVENTEKGVQFTIHFPTSQ